MSTSITKGALVDIPMALTEGLNSISPYEAAVAKKKTHVDDWKSGGVAAGKVSEKLRKLIWILLIVSAGFCEWFQIRLV